MFGFPNPDATWHLQTTTVECWNLRWENLAQTELTFFFAHTFNMRGFYMRKIWKHEAELQHWVCQNQREGHGNVI